MTHNNKIHIADDAQIDEDMNWREQKRPRQIKGEGTPGKFYFRITNPEYQLVEISRENAHHHYQLCFESV